MLLGKGLDYQTVLNGLGQGVLIFDSANRLALDNVAVRTILGNDLKLIRAEGWPAAAVLFNTRLMPGDKPVDSVRADAMTSPRPVRFRIYRGGEYVPAWASAIHGDGGEVYTMITIDTPDWSALTELVTRFLTETRDAIEATQGHVTLISQSIKRLKPTDTVEVLSKRIGGFTRLISTHMHRTAMLMDFMERLEQVRTGKVRERVRTSRRKIQLSDFLEDFLEELDGISLIDPETEGQDYRARIKTSIPEKLAVSASPHHLTGILRDLLRNAIMYSMRGTPVIIRAAGEDGNVQISVIDEGYGIRSSESERVFLPFQRARQPQIMGEFGYGLSLFLCKHEVEAMNGRIWFESEEGVGTTFSFKLPVWREDETQRPSMVETQEMPKPSLSPSSSDM
jgi:signal transduction histidine kinase